jgi:hypothetical protein
VPDIVCVCWVVWCEVVSEWRWKYGRGNKGDRVPLMYVASEVPTACGRSSDTLVAFNTQPYMTPYPYDVATRPR